MKEIKDIVSAYHIAQAQGKKTAIAMVVHVDGSSYRRAGARMLITEDGQLTGAISGGCLEGDALRKARLAIVQQKPVLVRYDTTDEDDAQIGVQLGCNGVIHILIEPVIEDAPDNPIRLFEYFLAGREPVAMVTVFNMKRKLEPQYGTRLLLTSDSKIMGQLPGAIGPTVIDDALIVLRQGDAGVKSYSYRHEYTCFIELLQPTIALVIAGAGNDALPLIKMAKVMGWQVTLVDGRPNYNTRERFPEADKLVIAKAGEVLDQIKPDDRTVFMLMTHNYNYDAELLRHLLPLQLPYIGVLGPKKRLERILQEIAGTSILNRSFENIYGPAGLDLGSDYPEQIALSILAQVQAVLSKLSGKSLKEKGFIHDRDKEQTVITHVA